MRWAPSSAMAPAAPRPAARGRPRPAGHPPRRSGAPPTPLLFRKPGADDALSPPAPLYGGRGAAALGGGGFILAPRESSRFFRSASGSAAAAAPTAVCPSRCREWGRVTGRGGCGTGRGDWDRAGNWEGLGWHWERILGGGTERW